MRAFRFGVQGAPGTTEPTWVDFARRAEDHGYDVVSLPDHLERGLAPLIALAYAAGVTERITLAPVVLAVDFRQPFVLADEVATLDELARRRLEVGRGAGWMADEYARAGIAFDPAPRRIARVHDAVSVVRAMNRPDLRVMVGGGGRRILTLAGQVADIVSVVTTNAAGSVAALAGDGTLERTVEKIGWVRQAAGRRFPTLELHTRVFAAADDEVALDLGSGAADSPHVLVRPARAMADKLLRLRDATGISYVTVNARFLDEFAPVLELLADR